MPLNPDLSVAAQTPFTPAERAVLVEKSEALKVALDKFIDACKNDDSQHMLEALIPCQQENDDIRNLVSGKLTRTLLNDVIETLGERHG